jgi:hypothetical protein
MYKTTKIGYNNIMKIENDIKNGVEALIEAAKKSYEIWSNSGDTVRKDMYERYCDRIKYKPGSKYIKILSDGGVHSFVVNTDNDKKFKRGDILKAASWATPARNFARGNVLDGSLECVRWTGAC